MNNKKTVTPEHCVSCRKQKDECLSLVCQHELCLLCGLQNMTVIDTEKEIDGQIKHHIINNIKCPLCKLDSYYN